MYMSWPATTSNFCIFVQRIKLLLLLLYKSLFAVFNTFFLILMQVIMQRLNKDNNALRGTHHTGDVLYVFFFTLLNIKSLFLTKVEEIEAFAVTSRKLTFI